MEETTDKTGSSCDQLVVIPHPTVARFVHRPTTPIALNLTITLTLTLTLTIRHSHPLFLYNIALD